MKNPESTDPKTNEIQKLNGYQWFRLVLTYGSIPLFLFICAKDLNWWQAWIISTEFFLAGIAGRIWAEQRHPGILAERNTYYSGSDLGQWDKILAPLMGISLSWPIYIVAGLDHRSGWSPDFSVWVNIIGLIIAGAGYALAVWALAENRYFSSMVRIQRERGHTVCDSGPYRLMRHPGYAGNIFALPGIVLALNSTHTIIPAAIALSISLIRTALEDKYLKEKLQGYREYAQRVRYKILPGIF